MTLTVNSDRPWVSRYIQKYGIMGKNSPESTTAPAEVGKMLQVVIGLFTAVGIRLRTLRYGFFTYRNPSHESARDTNFLGAVGSLDPQDGFADGKARLPAVSRGDFCHVTAGNWTKLTAVALSRAVQYYGRNFTKLPYHSRIRAVRGSHPPYRIRSGSSFVPPFVGNTLRDSVEQMAFFHFRAKVSQNKVISLQLPTHQRKEIFKHNTH
ncbi:hypothetical protein K438DRAFT_1768388 [Mycena galopus ATCC 62051]|nr:hypothetical protein K438DRAFT_1768388 [Mycena galopus ATCC 62051]